MTRSFRYPLRALWPDYMGGGAGLALSLGLIAFAQPAAPVVWVAAAVAALFLVYFGRTVCRQWTHIELDDAGVRAAGPLGATIRWADLSSMRLDYYSTRRDSEEGWMQLRLGDGQRAIRIDSNLEGFAELVDAAAREAALRDLALDAATLSNLQALRD